MATFFDQLLNSLKTGSESAAATISHTVQRIGSVPYPRSFQSDGQRIYFLTLFEDERRLGVLSNHSVEDSPFPGREFSIDESGQLLKLVLSATDATNAQRLRGIFPKLGPRQLRPGLSVGFGDRLGLATPGHIQSLRSIMLESGCHFDPVFAQQSIRENSRTGRSPQQVIDDATWGVFQEGWDEGFAADADHLKNEEDIEVCVEAGYTFYTIDPGEFVQDWVDKGTSPGELESLAAQLPWEDLETNLATLKDGLLGKRLQSDELVIEIAEKDLLTAAVKYGRAVAHTTALYRHLCRRAEEKGLEFGLEISVDETDSPTTAVEHLYVAHELRRLGVQWLSLAPRFPGFFEKGVDYRGDTGIEPDESIRILDQNVALHCLVSEVYGPYKLSLHSGSDKFTVYPVVSRRAGERVHLKTAGTSYLEALRTIAHLDPDVFRQMFRLALKHYDVDRASYHVSANLGSVPNFEAMEPERLPSLLEDFHSRQILHVTFGSLLAEPELKGSLFSILRHNEEAYIETLERHFLKHLRPFVQPK